MRGVKYVTYAFIAIITMTVVVSFWIGRFHAGPARRHTDTFLRILSSCSILLTFVFYYNLIKSEDDARLRAEQQDTDNELDRRNNARKELTILYEDIPNSVLSIVELNPRKKYIYAKDALDKGELAHGLTEYRLQSIVFDLWVSDVNMFIHRSPNMVNRVATIITQALSPILRIAWKEYSYQYSQAMNDFIATLYSVVDSHINMDAMGTPKYVNLALDVLEKTEHVNVDWKAVPPYYTFKEVEFINDQVKHFF